MTNSGRVSRDIQEMRVTLVVVLATLLCGVQSMNLRAESGGPPIYLPRKRCEICVTVLMRKMAQADHLVSFSPSHPSFDSHAEFLTSLQCSGMESYFETVS